MKKISFFIAIISLFVVTSCIRDVSGRSEIATISGISVKSLNDSVYMGGIVFSEENYIITAKDSLPYGCGIDSLILTVNAGKLASLKIFESENGVRTKEFDGLDDKLDTVNFSDTVYIETLSENKENSIVYKVIVYEHRQDPELYTWQATNSSVFAETPEQEKVLHRDSTLVWFVKTSSELIAYKSKEGKNWSRHAISGLPRSLNLKYITLADGTFYAAEGNSLYTSTDGLQWTKTQTATSIDHLWFRIGRELFAVRHNEGKIFKLVENNWTEQEISSSLGRLPDEFPVEGEGVYTDYSRNGVSRVYIVCGEDKNGNLLNSVWTSEDGSYWVNINSASAAMFTPRRDVGMFQYDYKLMVVGGRNAGGVLGENFFLFSPDYGINWKQPDENMAISSIFVPRYNAQTVVDNATATIYIAGGQSTSGTFMKDLWIGRKNGAVWELIK